MMYLKLQYITVKNAKWYDHFGTQFSIYTVKHPLKGSIPGSGRSAGERHGNSFQ